MTKYTSNTEKLNSKAKRELARIKESINSVNSYEAQKELLKGKKFINSFHTVESKVLTF